MWRRRLVTGDAAGRARAACGARPEAAAHELCVSRVTCGRVCQRVCTGDVADGGVELLREPERGRRAEADVDARAALCST